MRSLLKIWGGFTTLSRKRTVSTSVTGLLLRFSPCVRMTDRKFLNHGFASPAGNKIVMYDKKADAGIQLITPEGKVKILMVEGDKTMELNLDGKEMTITTTGDMKIHADGELKIDAKKGVKLESNGPIDIKATGNATLKGAKVAIN